MILRENTYLKPPPIFVDCNFPGQVIFSCVFGFDVTRPQSVDFSNQGEHIVLLLKQRQKMPSFFKSNSFFGSKIFIPSRVHHGRKKIGPLFYLFVFVRTKKPIPQKSLFSSTLQQVCISSNLKNQLLCWNNQLLS